MPARLLRLGVILVLIAVDVSIYWFWRNDNISYEGHLFGAVTGVCVALVLGRNVRLEKFEILFTLIGLLGYIALVTIAYAFGQYKAAASPPHPPPHPHPHPHPHPISNPN